jgi:hypothetical protein
MSYTRNRQSHLSGVGVLASATPKAVAAIKRARALRLARMLNHDRMLVNLATAKPKLTRQRAMGDINLGNGQRYVQGHVFGVTNPIGGGGPIESGGGGLPSGGYGIGWQGPGGGGPPPPTNATLLQRLGQSALRQVGLHPTPPLTSGGIPVPIYSSPGSTTGGGGGGSGGSGGSGGAGGPGGGSGAPEQTAPGPDGSPNGPADDGSLLSQVSNLSTGAKVAIAGGALAVLYAIFGGHR